jgi:hypothetical protein
MQNPNIYLAFAIRIEQKIICDGPQLADSGPSFHWKSSQVNNRLLA